MPPTNLPNLYCMPSDVFDDMGTEGVQLRLDDHVQATGQTVQVTANAAAGATSLAVVALSGPLLAGDTLEFDGGNLPAVVEVVLSATAALGATTLSVNALPSAVNAGAQALDSGVNAALAARLVKACRYATAQVKLYCSGRYDDGPLSQSWSVNRWATALAKRWISRRLTRPTPGSIKDDAEEALAEMRLVQIGSLQIEDIGTRTSSWPFITNVTVDVGYDVAKVRVEPQISEGTPTQYGQYVDWNSALFWEW